MRRPLAIIGAVISVSLLTAWGVQKYIADTHPAPASIGGAFSAIDHRGQPISDADLLGKPSVLFFGFTYCPEICPTTLANMTRWLSALGPDADRVTVAFVTIDPERDTAQQLSAYLSSFDPRIRGVTGSPKQIEAMAKAYRVYYRKVSLDGGGYTMDHSTAAYLMDSKGRFITVIGYNESDDTALGKLRELVRS
jgi:protein SCO1/2